MVRFFFALRPFPGYGLVALAAIAAYGAVAVAWSPEELDSALGLLLFVQLFISSSGFAPTARRGHFDPMLGHGRHRVAALASQWAASIAPGLLAWLLVVSSGLLAGSSGAWSALLGTRAAAFLIVSALSWSAGFAFPRGAGGVLWTAILMWLLLRHADLLAWAGSEATTIGLLRNTAVIAICPFLLIGSRLQLNVPAVVAACGFAAAVLLLTWRLGARLDVYLVERV